MKLLPVSQAAGREMRADAAPKKREGIHVTRIRLPRRRRSNRKALSGHSLLRFPCTFRLLGKKATTQSLREAKGLTTRPSLLSSLCVLGSWVLGLTLSLSLPVSQSQSLRRLSVLCTLCTMMGLTGRSSSDLQRTLLFPCLLFPTLRLRLTYTCRDIQ